MSRSVFVVALLASFSLAACNGSDGGSPSSDGDTGSVDVGSGDSGDSGSSSSDGSQSGDTGATGDGSQETSTSWLRGYVQSFDMAAVLSVRNSPAFQNATKSYTLTIDGNPDYANGKTVWNDNPLLEARVDYAHSVGLTGQGQTIAMIDDGIRLTHNQFAGKSVTVIGKSTSSTHGTKTAAIAAGNGDGSDGGTIGVAPGASIFMGQMDFTSAMDWSEAASYFNQFSDLDAIVSSNSWGTPDLTLSNTDMTSYFSTGSSGDYLAALRNYAKNGIIVFAMSNDYSETSAMATAGMAVAFPDLAPSFLSVINVIPSYTDDSITGGDRMSSACLETAAYCIDANGQFYGADNSADDAYSLGSGTSFATPQVAGAIALLAEAFPDLTPQQLRNRLLATADNGWFTTTGEVDFGDGVTHGYNEEFGHGFLDLKDALLPIGTTTIATNSSGASVIAGRAVVSGGALSGGAAAVSLASSRVAAIDSMSGTFYASGKILATDPTVPGDGRADVLREAYASSDMARARKITNHSLMGREMYRSGNSLDGSRDAMELAGISEQKLARGHEFSISTLDQGRGVALSKGFETKIGYLDIGGVFLSAQGNLMGVEAPGYESQTHGNVKGLRIGYAARIAPGFGLRVSGEFGHVDGELGGMAGQVHDLTYDRLDISLDAADVLQDGDVVSFFASRPAAISSGNVAMSIPVAYSSGQPVFSKIEVGLAPSDRQLDIGVQYGTALTDKIDMRTGLVRSINAGQISGLGKLTALIGVSARF